VRKFILKYHSFVILTLKLLAFFLVQLSLLVNLLLAQPGIVVERIVNQDHLVGLEWTACNVFIANDLWVGRRKDGVNCHSKNILYHARNYLSQDTAIHFKTRVRVSLNKEGIQLVVKHKVQPENLKTILFVLRVYLPRYCFNQLSWNTLHFIVSRLEFGIRIGLYIPLKLRQTYLIAAFKFAVLLPFFLNSIVGEVN